MKLSDFLNSKEEVLFHTKLSKEKETSIKTDYLGFTQKRVYHLRKLKRSNRIYRDIPLTEISYLETGWHDKNAALIIVGVLLLVVGLMLIPFILGLVSMIGIVLIIKGLKQYGYLMINSEAWFFKFKKWSDINKIEEFIRIIYFAEDI